MCHLRPVRIEEIALFHLALNDTDINSYQWNKNTPSILADTDSPSNTRNGVMIESVELIRLALMLVAVQQYCSINQPPLTTVIDIHTKPMTLLWTKLIPLWKFYSRYFMVGKVPSSCVTRIFAMVV